MLEGGVEGTWALVVRARGWRCALPARELRETLRPLPAVRIPGAPPYVMGVTQIRGQAMAVVDLGVLLGGENSSTGTDRRRFITLQSSGTARKVALAVDEVMGFVEWPSAELCTLPPLLADQSGWGIKAVAGHHPDLVLLLEGARAIPDDVWSERHRHGS